MADAQELRTKFLHNSARMILLSSPSTSRYLAHQSVELDYAQSTKSSSSAETVCAACGNLLLPGWTASTRIVTRTTATTSKTTSRSNNRKKILSRRCATCQRISKQVADISVDARRRRRTPAASVSEHRHMDVVPAESPAESAPEKTTKTSSKKRAKARKDREGLQALLNKSAQNKTGPSLNLMDLMRQP
ncbi:hypothetical protein HRR83_004703 [Exophiala dermatitidis]|uniref:Uncharacterized protein n=2 Tax=Exophiala dermatitidis TaxID=5970 RepID=H6BRV3_EXODN|nr:uncharacterized protein HMPREF1120_02232 [Exophiala dermatitidis NIH/UT8656]KAJ4519274.1 hypothetical protein HRR74_004015 [Exophiala dermatitidis]EHY54055.1 hypothetical protein HMPREF1120_02232 [Exophiala dermatitidis NIH/UT8656]KAJ4529090.1 hypothetical protein HRR73_000110 [Exophiala dermatitidis]KAJ4538490.1 hypothetical protein HRR77_006973 [Exophiala dermatitidis]KAJ4544264.1 hypothetical protein HRR76_002330 [Exophiala dermatitidis]